MSAPYPWQELIWRTLAAEPNKAKAWLLEGPLGLGQFDFAQAFLSKHCHAADVLCVEPENQNITVDQIREITLFTQQSPYNSPFKGVIVNCVDNISRNAQHAFLKTLEEPVVPTAFMLINASPRAVLATTKSRCQRLRFVPVEYADAKPWLEAEGLTISQSDYQLLGGEPLRVKTDDLTQLKAATVTLQHYFSGRLESKQAQDFVKTEPKLALAAMQQAAHAYSAQHPGDQSIHLWQDKVLELARQYALNPNLNMPLQLQALIEGPLHAR